MYALCVEASHSRGLGHLFRMLCLAECMRQRGQDFVFIVNRDDASRSILARAAVPLREAAIGDVDSGWETSLIAELKIQVWINDRLDTDVRHALRVTDAGAQLITFDDRGSGAEYADLHVAALAFLQGEHLGGRRLLTGIEYLILNAEIKVLRRMRKDSKRWIVTLGGTDTWGVTPKVVTALAERDCDVTVVLGPGFRHYAELNAVLPPRFQVKQGVPSLIAELAAHDVAVTGGGITAFEACSSGLPTIIVANEHFEVPVGRYLADLGCARFAGHYSSADWDVLRSTLPIEAMSAAGLAQVPADGVDRVWKAIAELQ